MCGNEVKFSVLENEELSTRVSLECESIVVAWTFSCNEGIAEKCIIQVLIDSLHYSILILRLSADAYCRNQDSNVKNIDKTIRIAIATYV